MSEPCITCGEKGKSEKQFKLEANRANMEEQGRAKAKAEGRNGYFIACSKNRISYIVALDIPEGSTLSWEYVSIL